MEDAWNLKHIINYFLKWTWVEGVEGSEKFCGLAAGLSNLGESLTGLDTWSNLWKNNHIEVSP